MDYLISVIVPVYNVEKYLAKSIESVIKQSYANLQIIIVDDGSTDESGKLCDEFAEMDDRIEVHHRKNEGVASARNFGIKIAKGEYVIFLDSDDWLEADYCEEMLSLALKHDADVVACNHRGIDGDVETSERHIAEDKVIVDPEECIRDYTNNQFYVYVVWGKIYRRSMLQKLSFKKMRIGEDTCFILDMFSIMNKIYLTTYVGYNYLSREGAVTKVKSFGDKDIDRLRIAAYFVELCKEKYSSYLEFSIYRLYRQAATSLLSLYESEKLSVCKKYSRKIKDMIEPYKSKNINIGRNLKRIIRLAECSDWLAMIYVRLTKRIYER